jgi:phosphoserine aminotransferase
VVSFYPGPSRVHDEIPLYTAEAFRKGILSLNHRSEEFMALAQQTTDLLRQKLAIPAPYEIYITTSATECWEVIAQSIVSKGSAHFHCGSFGEKWFDYTKKLNEGATSVPFDRESPLESRKVGGGDVICITQNETSNGTQVDPEIIRSFRDLNPGHLIAIDATSSMAGIALDFTVADIWFASVQKCFGLPAGLALMVCSPRAVRRVGEINERSHYNSLIYVKEMMDKHQTNCTPNVLGIYLLMRTLKKMPPIARVDKEVRKRAAAWEKLLDSSGNIRYMVNNKGVRSLTVLALTGTEETVVRLKQKARAKGFLLGDGYGALKKSTFRIANFPALKSTEVAHLMEFMKGHL